MTDEGKVAGDVISLTVLGGTLVDILPAAAATLTIIWTTIRIYETKTVQRILKKQ